MVKSRNKYDRYKMHTLYLVQCFMTQSTYLFVHERLSHGILKIHIHKKNILLFAITGAENGIEENRET